MSLRDSFYVSTFAEGFEGGYPFQSVLSKIVNRTKSEAIEFVDGFFSVLGDCWDVIVRLENGQFAIVHIEKVVTQNDGIDTVGFDVWPTFDTYATESEASTVLETDMESEEEWLIRVHMEKGRDGIRDNVDFEKCYEDLHRIDINRKLRLGYSKEEAEALLAMEEVAAELPSEDKIGGWAD